MSMDGYYTRLGSLTSASAVDRLQSELKQMEGELHNVQVTNTKYRMEGNFGSGKIWRIHCMNTLAEENLANCEILQVKIFRKTYSVEHIEDKFVT